VLIATVLQWQIEGKNEQEKLEELQSPVLQIAVLSRGVCLIQGTSTYVQATIMPD
jgi:hypothetical protein